MPEPYAPPASSEPLAGTLDALLAAHDCAAQDRTGAAVAAGRASRDVVRRVVLEHYSVTKWTTAELPLLIAGAPDAYRLTMDHSAHYRHWARHFAERAGYAGRASDVGAALAWCRALGLTDDDVRAYAPLPETIAAVCTMLFYARRSYEEGVAAVGLAAERVGLGAAAGRRLGDALRAHYGVAGPALPPPADDGPDAAALLARVATTPAVRERCREAVRNVVLTAECRVRAMSRWVE